MKIQILFIFSIISIAIVAGYSSALVKPKSQLFLRQEILVLENNAFRNLLKEQNLYKRNQVLEKALLEIEKLRSESPMQLSGDEKVISKIVQNLKSMGLQNQAQHKEVL